MIKENLIPIKLSDEVLEMFENKNYRNISDTIMNQFHRQTVQLYNKVLEDYIKKNLLKFGYNFKTDEEFLKFVSERIMRISFADSSNDHQYFLDYKSEDNKGTLIGITNEHTHFEYEKNKITVTIGRNFK